MVKHEGGEKTKQNKSLKHLRRKQKWAHRYKLRVSLSLKHSSHNTNEVIDENLLTWNRRFKLKVHQDWHMKTQITKTAILNVLTLVATNLPQRLERSASRKDFQYFPYWCNKRKRVNQSAKQSTDGEQEWLIELDQHWQNMIWFWSPFRGSLPQKLCYSVAYPNEYSSLTFSHFVKSHRVRAGELSFCTKSHSIK